MEKSKEFKDLQEIKSLMERSSRFLSLSGLSGVSAGIIALIAAAIAYYLLDFGRIKYTTNFYLLRPMEEFSYQMDLLTNLLILAIATFVLALASAYYFSWRKAKKYNYSLWDHTTKRLLFQLFIPLIAGGVFALILIDRNDGTLLAAVTLIFYGLALVNAGKYTLSEVQYLGISEIVLGLLAGIFTCWGLLFWAIGFGILHIIYGLVMYYRYER
ncbi:MAG: hypothetical protein KDC09_11680 [Bacteroidales bacterium]|nr:hypothetical protein [Bacteroidales bacterium]